jgi:hypothetical protein
MTIINNAATAQAAIAGLSISTSNVLITRTPVITSQGIGEVAANISSPDHSLNYTSGTQALDFTVSYGVTQNITYVAISGQNSAGAIGSTIQLYDGATLIQSVTTTRNHNIMFTFALRSFADLIVKFQTAQNTQQVTVSFIAAGTHLNVETGEQAGYSRTWLLRHTQESVTTNLVSAPVGTIQKNKPLMGNLSLPNETAIFAEGLWQTFMDFSYEQPFFIKEVESKPESSYICFNPKHSITAHPQTRKLDAVSLKFTAYNGL